jgi:hypothetical protein
MGIGKLAELLLSFSDSQLDACTHPLIRKWDEEPTSFQILEVLDKCIYSSLASSFVISALQVTYDLACKRESTTHEEVVKLATWREEHAP